jgi:uncharacterized protein YbcI
MTQQDNPRTVGDKLAAISTSLVRLHREFYGKGPTRAKSFLLDDTILCLLQGGLTIVERTLVDVGDAKAVHDIRHSFQAAMKHEFTKVVEDATGRKVIAYMSQVHTDPDLSAEIFVLEPIEASERVIAHHEEDLTEATERATMPASG